MAKSWKTLATQEMIEAGRLMGDFSGRRRRKAGCGVSDILLFRDLSHALLPITEAESLMVMSFCFWYNCSVRMVFSSCFSLFNYEMGIVKRPDF